MYDDVAVNQLERITMASQALLQYWISEKRRKESESADPYQIARTLRRQVDMVRNQADLAYFCNQCQSLIE